MPITNESTWDDIMNAVALAEEQSNEVYGDYEDFVINGCSCQTPDGESFIKDTKKQAVVAGLDHWCEVYNRSNDLLKEFHRAVSLSQDKDFASTQEIINFICQALTTNTDNILSKEDLIDLAYKNMDSKCYHLAIRASSALNDEVDWYDNKYNSILTTNDIRRAILG